MVNFCRNQGVNINLENPTTIQDKLAWLNIYDENPLKTKCADKIKIHEYCKEKLGKDICIPILHVYDKVEDINWEELPEQFVMKCNHGSGMNIIVKDKKKLNIEDAKRKLNYWMDDNFALRNGFEAHYYDIDRKIFVEEYKEDMSGGLVDYKFLCFNGKPTYVQLFYGRFTSGLYMNYYDMNFNIVDLARKDFKNRRDVHNEKPKNLKLMQEYAEKLSSEFKFVRVDFYEINGEIYLGELTFTPGAMAFKYETHEDEVKVGGLLDISDDIKKKVLMNDNTKEEKETNDKILIYTGLIGDYDVPYDNFRHKEGYDYVLLSDVPIETKSWENRIVSFGNGENLSPIKKARYLKTHPHELFDKNYDFVVWVDANTFINDKLYKYINKYKDSVITFKEHNDRDCVYDEIMVCAAANKETPIMALKVYDKCARSGYPRKIGLFETNIIISHYTDSRVIELMDNWWNEIFHNSHRDQLSLNYVIWKNHYEDWISSAQTKDFPPRKHVTKAELEAKPKKKRRLIKFG